MLTHFGTVFAVPQIPYILRLFNTFNTPLTLLNFHKNEVANVSRETVVINVSRGTKDGMMKMFHVEQTSVNKY